MRKAGLLLILLVFSNLLLPTTAIAESEEQDQKEDLVAFLNSLAEKGFSIGEDEWELVDRIFGCEQNQSEIEREDVSPFPPEEIVLEWVLESIEESATTNTYYVSIGTDSTFYASDLGDAATVRVWGLPVGLWGADYVLADNKDRGAVLLYPSFGGVSVAAWVGPKVVITGSGTATAKFFVNGHLLGYLWSAATWWGVSTSYVRVGIGYKDLTTDQGAVHFVLAYESWPFLPLYLDTGINAWFPATIEIEAGHTYVFFLLLEAGADAYGGAGAVSDFGPQDGDYAGEGLWFNYIKLDFQ